MQPRHITTDGVAERESFAFWQDVICDTFIRLDCSSPIRKGFSGSVQSHQFGRLQLSSMASDKIHLTRSRSRIAAAREEYCLVVVQGGGRTLAEQDGRQVVLETGDIALFDSVRPYRAELQTGFHHYVLKVPRDTLRDRLGPIEALTALRIPGDRGIGSIASHFIRALPAELGQLNDLALSGLSDACLDLLTTAFATAAPISGEGNSSVRTMHLVRAKAFIAANLQDEALSPSTVATALGISVRYLNSLFASENASVSRHIWKLRLERCKAALADPSQRHRTMSDIAFSWGFNDSSHFSRMFREETGMSPGSFRQAAGNGT